MWHFERGRFDSNGEADLFKNIFPRAKLESNLNTEMLAPPPLSKEDSSIEVLRLWVKVDWTRMQVSLRTHHDDPAVWGLAIVDIARHVAKAYALNGGMSENDALHRIKQLIDAEWSAPTDIPEGKVS